MKMPCICKKQPRNGAVIFWIFFLEICDGFGRWGIDMDCDFDMEIGIWLIDL